MEDEEEFSSNLNIDVVKIGRQYRRLPLLKLFTWLVAALNYLEEILYGRITRVSHEKVSYEISEILSL